LEETSSGVIVDLYVKPNSREFRIETTPEEVVVFSQAPPKEGRANEDILKHLSKLFGVKVLIVSGLKSRRKRVLVVGATPEHIRKTLVGLRR
jgi:uncharacterized protein (TIGR00251 family)